MYCSAYHLHTIPKVGPTDKITITELQFMRLFQEGALMALTQVLVTAASICELKSVILFDSNHISSQCGQSQTRYHSYCQLRSPRFVKANCCVSIAPIASPAYVANPKPDTVPIINSDHTFVVASQPSVNAYTTGICRVSFPLDSLMISSIGKLDRVTQCVYISS